MRRARGGAANQSLDSSSRPARTDGGSCQGGGSVASPNGGIKITVKCGSSSSFCDLTAAFPPQPIVAPLLRLRAPHRATSIFAVSDRATSWLFRINKK
jgi:hypothetical protein